MNTRLINITLLIQCLCLSRGYGFTIQLRSELLAKSPLVLGQRSPVPERVQAFRMTTDAEQESSSSPGDKMRESNGKRPSLNPTIINAISEALLIRSSPSSKDGPMEITDGVSPVEVAVAAGQLASSAIDKRAQTSTAVKGDEGSAFNQEESQLVAGRVVGVVMRWEELEGILVDRVKGTKWVMKYGEEASFGLMKDECKDGCDKKEVDADVKQRLRDDPLMRMCRSECLYALFLQTVEMPAMEKIGQLPSDASSGIDFLDSDRIEVLLQDEFS